MGARFWSFLLGLGPVRRAVDEEAERRMGSSVRSAWEAHDTHRKTLAARDELIAELRRQAEERHRHADDLGRRVEELEAENRELRKAVTARPVAEPPPHPPPRPRAAQPARPAQLPQPSRPVAESPDPGASTDLFRCLDCSSLWLLSTRSDGISTVSRPVGPGCPACTDQPLRRLREARSPRVAAEVARPASAAHGCAGLNAIADGIERPPAVIRNGIVWCATEIIGDPEFPARVLAEIAAQAPSDLRAVARRVRLAGARSCAAEPCVCTHRPAPGTIARPGTGHLTKAIYNGLLDRAEPDDITGSRDATGP